MKVWNKPLGALLVYTILLYREPKNLTCFLQILVLLNSVFIHTLFGGASGLTSISSDIMDETVDQVIMDLLIAVIDKAQKIDMHNLFIKLAQPEDRIISH